MNILNQIVVEIEEIINLKLDLTFNNQVRCVRNIYTSSNNTAYFVHLLQLRTNRAANCSLLKFQWSNNV